VIPHHSANRPGGWRRVRSDPGIAGSRVALKVLAAESARDAYTSTDFAVKRGARPPGCTHTNIVAIHGAGQADGVHFLVMELINGVGLDVVIGDLRGARAPRLAPAAIGDRTVASGLSTTATP